MSKRSSVRPIDPQPDHSDREPARPAVRDLGGLNAVSDRRADVIVVDIVVLAFGRFSRITHGEGTTDGRHSGLGRCGGCPDRERPSAVGRQEILTDPEWLTDVISIDLRAFKRGNATWELS
jgi:hypothetical protein